MNVQSYESLAALLKYPDEDFMELVISGEATMRRYCADAAPSLARFLRSVEAMTPTELQELYTHTFDLNPVAALEVGWQLYGEQYERGRFLVKLREKLEHCGLEESTELPDHLIHILPLLPRLERADASRLAAACVIPAVEKMRAPFEGKNNPYEHVMSAIGCVLALNFPSEDREGVTAVTEVTR